MTTGFDPGRRRVLLGAAGTAALFATGGGLLAGCGSDDDGGGDAATTTTGATTETTAAAAAVEPASLSAMMPFAASLGYVLHFTAKTRGHFEAEKLTVDIQFARGAGQALQALLAGQVQLAQMGVLNLVPAITDQKADAVSIAMPVQGVLYQLLSPKAAPIDTLADVVGKRVGLPSLGGHAEETLRQVMAEADLDPSSVELVAAGFDAAAYGLIEAGRIDAMFANIDIVAVLEDQGASFVVADLGDTNPLHGHVFATTGAYAEENPDVLVRYLRAIDAARAELEDPELIDEVIAELTPEWDIAALKNPALAKKIISFQQELWFSGGPKTFLRHDPKLWEQGLEGFGRIGAVKADLDPTTFFTNEFLDEALAS